MNKKRRAFTIVELVIVIAVIGILSAILIPTFINLTAKANLASDETLVRNLNTSLSLEELESRDTKNITYYDAINDLKYYGYTEDNLITKSDSLLLWNEEDNRFYLSSSLKLDEIKEQHYWLLSDSFDNNYSKCKKDESTISYIDVNVSFDVGKYNNVEVLKYINNIDHSIMTNIRTNKGDTYITNMEINGHDTLYSHYGNLKSLVIKDAKEYHEYGNVLDSNVTIHQGKIYIYKDSNVDKITIGSGTGDVEVITYKDVDIEVSLEDESRVTTHNYSSSEAYIYNGYINDEAEFDAAVTSGGSYILEDDIDFNLANSISVASGKDFALDLNGHTITQEALDVYFLENNGGSITLLDRKGGGEILSTRGVIQNKSGTTHIINGTYRTTDTGWETVNPTRKRPQVIQCVKGEVTIEDGTFNGVADIVMNHYGTVTINGGTYTNKRTQPFTTYFTGVTTINDCVVNSEEGFVCARGDSSIIINGGTYVNEVVTVYSESYNLSPIVLDCKGVTATTGAHIEVNGGNFTFKTNDSGRYFAVIKYPLPAGSYSSNCGIFISDTSITITDLSGNPIPRSFAFYYNCDNNNAHIDVGEDVACNINTNQRKGVENSDNWVLHDIDI